MTSSKQWLYSLPLHPLPRIFRPSLGNLVRDLEVTLPTNTKISGTGKEGGENLSERIGYVIPPTPGSQSHFKLFYKKAYLLRRHHSGQNTACLLHCPFTSKISVHFPERAYLRLTPSHLFLELGDSPDCDQSWFQLCLFRL